MPKFAACDSVEMFSHPPGQNCEGFTKMIPKFAAVKTLDGYDDTASPNWLMIGLDTEKSVLLSGGNQLEVKVRRSEIAEITNDAVESATLQQRIITIKGKKKGTTFVDAFEGNIRKATLEICVKSKREITVSFHYVHDNAGHGTIRNSSNLHEWLDTINNKVFLPQANVFVRLGIINDPLRIERNLGTVIRDTSSYPNIPKREHETDEIMSHRDKTAQMNVFFVTNIEAGEDPKKNLIAGVQYDEGIFIDDNINTVSALATIENVLAHEIAHYLGVGGESHFYKAANIKGLMYYKARGGLFIPKVHANMINR